jgi:WD40 repeat protein
VFSRLHYNSVLNLAFLDRIGASKSERWLTGSFDGSMRLWAGAPGSAREMGVAQGDFGPLRAMAVNTATSTVLAGHRDGTVRLWDLGLPAQRAVPLGGGAPSAAFLGRSRRLVHPAALHDFSAGMTPTTTIEPSFSGNHGDLWSVAASPDGSFFATASHDGTVRIWDAQPLHLRHTCRGHESLVWSLAVSSDSKIVASGSGDIRLWDAATGRELRNIDTGGFLVRALAFHPTNGTIIAATKQRVLRAWKVDNGEPAGEPVKFDSEVMALAVRPDGRQLAGASSDETVMLWDLPSDRDARWLPSKPSRQLTGHHTRVWAVTYSPDGRWLASGSEHGVMLSDSDNGARLATLRGPDGQVRSLSFSADGELLAAASYMRPAVVWNLPAIRKTLAEMGLDW